MKFKNNLKLKSGIIDPVPLMDIVLQIALFFVLATQFLGKPGVIVQLPKVEKTALYKETAMKILISENELHFNNKKIGIDELNEELSKGLIDMLVIEADEEIQHARILKIIEIARKNGINEVAIAVQTDNVILDSNQ